MFLIRYIPDIVKPNVDNLATLCVNEVDADKLALKRRIQESLARLEQQRLVSRNGDLWFFLTNEERDVAREIGHVEVSANENGGCSVSCSTTTSSAGRPRYGTRHQGRL
jgi:fructose-1-phosphate kinase PfkB-like protein